MTTIIGPVLVVGPSVDYGLHVFMRYREEREARSASEDRAGSARGDAPRSDERGAKRPASGATREERSEAEVIREPMVRGLSSVAGALHTVVTGIGGALLGSTLTSVGACALLLHPHSQTRSFGTLVVLALSLSFVVAVFVLPNLLLTWANHGSVDAVRRESPTRDGPTAQD